MIPARPPGAEGVTRPPPGAVSAFLGPAPTPRKLDRLTARPPRPARPRAPGSPRRSAWGGGCRAGRRGCGTPDRRGADLHEDTQLPLAHLQKAALLADPAANVGRQPLRGGGTGADGRGSDNRCPWAGRWLGRPLAEQLFQGSHCAALGRALPFSHWEIMAWLAPTRTPSSFWLRSSVSLPLRIQAPSSLIGPPVVHAERADDSMTGCTAAALANGGSSTSSIQHSSISSPGGWESEGSWKQIATKKRKSPDRSGPFGERETGFEPATYSLGSCHSTS